jgi:hypothetical protein
MPHLDGNEWGMLIAGAFAVGCIVTCFCLIKCGAWDDEMAEHDGGG